MHPWASSEAQRQTVLLHSSFSFSLYTTIERRAGLDPSQCWSYSLSSCKKWCRERHSATCRSEDGNLVAASGSPGEADHKMPWHALFQSVSCSPAPEINTGACYLFAGPTASICRGGHGRPCTKWSGRVSPNHPEQRKSVPSSRHGFIGFAITESCWVIASSPDFNAPFFPIPAHGSGNLGTLEPCLPVVPQFTPIFFHCVSHCVSDCVSRQEDPGSCTRKQCYVLGVDWMGWGGGGQ